MPSNFTFYLVFISQILLLSVYYPKKIMNRVNHVLDNHPPSEYPKLYTQSIEQIKRGQLIFLMLNITLALIGFGYLVYAINSHTIPTSNQLTMYLLLQYMPLMFIELSGNRQLKLMRAANAQSIKKASLSPRKLFDFVSPAIVYMALGLYLAMFLLTLHVEGIHTPWYAGYGNLVAITYANIFLLGIVFWKIRSIKQNPYSSNKDYTTEMITLVKTMFFMSIGISLYTASSMALKHLDHLMYLQSTITSVYFQLLAFFSIGYMLRTIKMEHVDFSVYKVETSHA